MEQTNTLQLLSPGQVAKILHCRRMTVVKLCKEGRIKSFNAGTAKRDRWLMRLSAVLAYMEQLEQPRVRQTKSTARRKRYVNTHF